jgi:hypothetical protein
MDLLPEYNTKLMLIKLDNKFRFKNVVNTAEVTRAANSAM